MGTRRWFAVVALGALVGGGCGGNSEVGATCTSDGDCAVDERCDASETNNRPLAGNSICPYTPCSSRLQCLTGYVCGSSEGLPAPCGPSVCVLHCTTTGCNQGDVCGLDGFCTLVPCDESNGLICPDRWQCAPNTTFVAPPFGPGSDLAAEATSSERARRAGCVPLRCDEEGGYSCRDLYACDPANSEDASGCVPMPCTETGRCSDDMNQICAAEVADLGARTPDAHGCVTIGCGEGYECAFDGTPWIAENPRSCAPDDPRADPFGCVLRRCDEIDGLCGIPAECPTCLVCDPASPRADELGCRPPTCEDTGCSIEFVCEPSNQYADENGCVPAIPERGVCVARN